ncbi:MAG: tetratricopeptide repeat protein, partial [Anaerolineae bacterium]|nr:tetratricopeptide repeat protein [Anaerolineae bacterium]
MGRFRFYQWVILLIAVGSTLYIGVFSIVVYAKSTQTDIALQNATEVPPVATPSGVAPAETLPELATQVFEQSQAAANAANDAQRYAQDASGSAGQHMEIANDLLGLFQNVTAIVGVLIPILALVGGYLGFNQLNEAQNRLEEARTGFQKDVKEKQEELQKVREALEHSARAQQDNVARATQALSLLPLGERQFRIGDYEGAIGAYERALELAPDSIIVHYRLGYV